jgi:hypothetical protein
MKIVAMERLEGSRDIFFLTIFDERESYVNEVLQYVWTVCRLILCRCADGGLSQEVFGRSADPTIRLTCGVSDAEMRQGMSSRYA